MQDDLFAADDSGFKVGDGVSVSDGTQTFAATVRWVAKDGKSISVQPDSVSPAGGSDEHEQRWSFAPSSDAPAYKAHKKADGFHLVGSPAKVERGRSHVVDMNVPW